MIPLNLLMIKSALYEEPEPRSSLAPPLASSLQSFMSLLLPASLSLLRTHPKYLLLEAWFCIRLPSHWSFVLWLTAIFTLFYCVCRNLGQTRCRQVHSVEGQRTSPRSGLLTASASSTDSSAFWSFLLLMSQLLYQPCVISRLFWWVSILTTYQPAVW